MSDSANISIITSSIASFPLIKSLSNRKRWKRVITTETSAMLGDMMQQQFPEVNLTITKGNPISCADTELIVVFGFGEKLIPQEEKTIVNIHFGPLPENRGPDPIFWTLKEGKNLAYITIHQLTTDLDSGPILKQKGYSIFPGENYGMLVNRLGILSTGLMEELLQNMPPPTPQEQKEATYKPLPTEADLKIDWSEMTSHQIEKLVLACNPKYGGAKATLNNNRLNLYEVTPANVNLSAGQQASPGLIVHASKEQGLFVACKEQTFVRVDIVASQEAIMSGHKLAAMGLQAGLVFE